MYRIRYLAGRSAILYILLACRKRNAKTGSYPFVGFIAPNTQGRAGVSRAPNGGQDARPPLFCRVY